MSTAIAPKPNCTRDFLLWVRSDNGQPRVRWSRIIGYVALFNVIQLMCMVVVSWYAQTSIRPTMFILLQAGVLAYLIVAIELQYRYVVSGKWRFHLGLKTWFALTLIACVFFAAARSEIMSLQEGQAANNALRSQLQRVVASGSVSIGRPDGTGVSVNATRADFSDADLAQAIELASQRTGQCELTLLVLEKTSVTSAGVEQLSACRKLTFLALPSIPLSAAALRAIGGNRDLKYLMLDEAQLTPGQRTELRQMLPAVMLNGQPAP